MEASRIIPLTRMSKNPRYECIGTFSLRFLPDLGKLSGGALFGLYVYLFEIKAKNRKQVVPLNA
jgi:hypothetical protein